MANTKELILQISLALFARKGYEAVSVSTIANELNMTKSALYKHYKNKRDIFDSILERMIQTDLERARKYNMPEGTFETTEESYAATKIENIKTYTEAQFRYWTEDEFASNFRKMLTLEQYQDSNMSQLYQQYFAAGPLRYTEDLFASITNNQENAKILALRCYAPVFALYSICDSTTEKGEILTMLRNHIYTF